MPALLLQNMTANNGNLIRQQVVASSYCHAALPTSIKAGLPLVILR